MKNRIDELLKEVFSFSTKDQEELEAFRIKFLGKKGVVTSLFSDFKNVPPEERKELGQLLNNLKTGAQEKIKEIKATLEKRSEISDDFSKDLSLPADFIKVGNRHPLSVTRNEIIEIFTRLGYTISRGP